VREVNLKIRWFITWGVRVWLFHFLYTSVLLQGLCNGCQQKVGMRA